MDDSKTLELADINTASFLSLQGVPVTLINRAGRVFFSVSGDDFTYEQLAKLEENVLVPARDFISHLKKMRALMLDARGDGNGPRRMGR